MRRFFLALDASAMLGGCISTLENGYISRARHECGRSTRAARVRCAITEATRERREQIG